MTSDTFSLPDVPVVDEAAPSTAPFDAPVVPQVDDLPEVEATDGITDEPPLVEHAAEVDSPAITYLRPAGVTVRLAHPFKIGERWVEEVHLPPVSLGVALDVQAGLHETLMDILIASTGESLALFRALRGGDEEAVIGAFLPLLPASIRGVIDGAR
ncbi:hypothetical protein KHC23_10920 [Ancylobacter dichloromethanicus]|uniref:Uncharacterized protein n=1 Tax=Ancylobacter dichloromethanicus TaxID=518825 RepID=A0A9W6J5L2_9HYPH|nr:hypothetical protein [Ancylobacter dichloromethanicus]MBS7554160.1 hypothetical protein [Ancylobacter dichloromethanicus]GLK71280.1 hypothetical protein GCM10017643_13950 [Ancylobacter dichloromethanicus]